MSPKVPFIYLFSYGDNAFNRYDEETIYFDDSVRNAKRKQLESNALDVRLPATSKGFILILVMDYDPFELNFDKAVVDCTVEIKSSLF